MDRDSVHPGEQDLSKMSQDELLDLIEKDFNRLWQGVQEELLAKDQRTVERRGKARIKLMAEENFDVYEDENNRIIVIIRKSCEKLTFDCKSSFADIVGRFPAGTAFIFDFQMVKFISSSVLHMLLDFHRNNGNVPATIVNCNAVIYRVFDVARLTEIFDIQRGDSSQDGGLCPR